MVAVLSRLTRLSYYDRVKAAVPEAFRPLMPPPPVVQGLPAAADVPSGDGPEPLQTRSAAELLQMVGCLFVPALDLVWACIHRLQGSDQIQHATGPGRWSAAAGLWVSNTGATSFRIPPCSASLYLCSLDSQTPHERQSAIPDAPT